MPRVGPRLVRIIQAMDNYPRGRQQDSSLWLTDDGQHLLVSCVHDEDFNIGFFESMIFPSNEDGDIVGDTVYESFKFETNPESMYRYWETIKDINND